MTETKMNVQLLAHTQLSDKFYRSLDHGIYDVFLGRCDGNHLDDYEATDAQSVALSAVRTRYSVNKPSEIGPKKAQSISATAHQMAARARTPTPTDYSGIYWH
ncbi:hypothetical protein [Bacillus pumilus]|uniref:hypothetical protein n=1 Tax=Bacillus pumilus TaxID=1408 RepID=UPI003B66BF17